MAKDKKKKKKKKKAKRKAQPKLTNAMCRKWGFECETMTQAAVNYSGNLVDRLGRSKALMASWQRGRFLRDISQFAAAGLTKAEVAVKLAIELGEFERQLSEPEAADVWQRGQIDTLARLKMGILASAMAGKPASLARFERILQSEKPDGALDIYRMTEKQMIVIAGVSRQTIHAWVTEKGLSRNSDMTFDLRVFVKWFEGHSQRKVNVSPVAAGPDEHRDVKTARLKLLYDEEIGRLVPRDSVIAGLVGRLQQFLTIWDRLVESVADKCLNMPKAGVLEILGKFKDQLCAEFAKVDIEMKLSPQQQAELERLLKKLQ